MTCYISSVFGAGAQLLDNQGRILSGGTIETYLAGSSTPLATFTDSTGITSNGTIITLDSYGRTPQEIWLNGGQSYKFIIKNSSGVVIQTLDNIVGVNDPANGTGGGTTTVSEWVSLSGTIAYINATSFSVNADVTASVVTNRRIKFVCSGGTGYATVQSAVYAAGFTTVTLVNDSLTLDSGLSAVSYSFLNPNGPSVDAAGVTFKPTLSQPQGSVGRELVRVNQSSNVLTTGGTSTAYTLTPTAPLTAYAGSPPFRVKFHTAPGASPTINISGLGAKNLKAYNEQTPGVTDPSLVTGHEYMIAYDSTLDAVIVLNTTVDGYGGAVSLASLSSFAKLNSASGYQKLPGGLILQWAVSTITFGGTNTVSWPTPFSAAPLSVVVNNGVGDYTAITESFPIVLSTSSSNVVVTNQYIGDAAGSPVTIKAQILAIGF